ncbi:Pre-mRNA splicing Prp18-interacting factor-domain-containing protein [Geopyxis carbonaria]|nr:Pre-mRNA splicing Prp18-interacting factor-domain-containing protein [Geopyxis carbonaria]
MSMSSNKPPGRDDNRRGAANPEKQSRNEYIPHFIQKKPFYIDSRDGEEDDYLKHQRLQDKKKDDFADQKWYDRGKRQGPAATKYRKGACKNCGAMTHAEKDCLQRPRKTGAKWSGQDIQADEVIEDIDLSWDGKRDRWNGYDAREHRRVVEEHARLEKLRKEAAGEVDKEEDGEEGDDEDKYAEESEMPGQAYDSAARISTRNLRIREDTAKYLLNLDLDSARYDPKTRTMVDKGATADRAAALVAEEDFIRSSGDVQEFERLQKSAWESQERGDKNKLHLQANPTEAEALRKRLDRERAEAAEKKRKEMIAKYGGAEHMEKPPEIEAEEIYVEYTESGQIKGEKKIKQKSKYIEDKYVNNHTSVWGSWWENFKWGYACCHSTIRNSYCTGEDGIKAADEARNMRLGLVEPRQRTQIEDRNPDAEPIETEKLRERESEPVAESKVGGLTARGADRDGDDKEGKRKLEHMLGGVTEDDMEIYRKQKRLHDDPMANFVDAV